MATAARLLRHPLVHLLLIAVAGVAAFSGTLDDPFVFDDRTSIVENSVVHGVRNFFEGWAGYHHYPRRFFGYLTFALNYHFNGLKVTGYHFFNLCVHILSGLLVYRLSLLTFRSPLLAASSLAPRAPHLALFASLVFVLHPVQTQAVTYITQRLASLAALLYLTSIVLWVHGLIRRDGEAGSSLSFWSFGAFLAALAATMTKETALTLPLAAALYAQLFYPRPWRRVVTALWPFLAGLMIPCLIWSTTAFPAGSIAGAIDQTRGGYEVSRLQYLLTEPRVLITYMRLLFFPANQSVDYQYPIQSTFLSISVISSVAIIASLLGVAALILHRSIRNDVAGGRVASFAILWFFLTLMVESSVFPLDDVIAEHRLYLPLAGVAVGFAAAVGVMADRWRERLVVGGLAIALVVLFIATWLRNEVWASPVALWADAVSKAPMKGRPRYNLGTALNDAGYPEEAVHQLGEAVRLESDNGDAWSNLGAAYAALGRDDKAMEAFTKALATKPGLPQAYNGMGALLVKQGKLLEATSFFREALRWAPLNGDAHSNLGAAYGIQGKFDDAILELERAVRLDPQNASYLKNLKRAYAGRGGKAGHPVGEGR